jgi:chromosome segregation ATPase
MNTTVIEAAARRLATAEHALNEANDRHQAASDHVATIRARIDEAEARRQRYRADLAAGRLDEREAGGLLATVNEDLSDLAGLLREAERHPDLSAPASAQAELDAAQADFERAQKDLQFNALVDHAREIERVFLATLAELHALGTQLGRPRSIQAVYRFTPDLMAAITTGQPPKVSP